MPADEALKYNRPAFRVAACALVWCISCLGCSDDALRPCPIRGHSRDPIPLSTAFSDCAEGIYRSQATVAPIHTFSEYSDVRIDLSEGACSISFDVSRPIDDWPSWPWLVEGAQLDITLWDMGADTRGGAPLWMVLRDSVTGDPLLSIYQLDRSLIDKGQVRDEIGIEANIVGPVCESSADGMRVQGYELRFSSEGKRITLGLGSEGSLPSSNASLSWKIQTGLLENSSVDPATILLDAREGEFIQFVAWTEAK